MKKVILIAIVVLVALLAGFIASSYHEDIPAQEVIDRYAYEDSKFLQLNGMNVHYRITGDTGQYVVLLHGTAASLHTWEGWTEVLSKQYRVVSFDLPGFGFTGPEPDNVYTRERYLTFIHDMLNELDIDSCHMAGNSFGGYMAWSYAVRHPDRIMRMAILNSSGYPRGKQPTPLGFKVQRVDWLEPVLLNITPRPIVKKSVQLVYHDDSKITEELVQRYFEILLCDGNRRGLMGKMTQITYEFTNEISQIQTPTLIMWGEHDRIVTPEDAPKFHREIPSSELIVYNHLGHVIMEEDPSTTVADFMDFLKK